jgi:hypothetical protein
MNILRHMNHVYSAPWSSQRLLLLEPLCYVMELKFEMLTAAFHLKTVTHGARCTTYLGRLSC